MSLTTPLLVGATFTAAPLDRHLKEALSQAVGVPAVSFLPYNQVLQVLLDSTAESRPEALLLLLRVSDLLRSEDLGVPGWQERLQTNANLYKEAIESWQEHTGCTCRVMLVPPPDGLPAEQALACRQAESALQQTANVRWLEWGGPEPGDGRLFDPVADKLGHIPFTEAGWRRLATIVANALANGNEPRPGKATSPVASGGDGMKRFLERLRLRVECHALESEAEWAAAGKLSHTAATFHASGRKFTPADLRSLAKEEDARLLAIDCADRFGQYVSAGYLLLRNGPRPVIEEWVVSCVVLGKQLEHCVLHALAIQAQRQGIERLGIVAIESPESQVWQWLAQLGRSPSVPDHRDGKIRWFDVAALIDGILSTAGSAAMITGTGVSMPPDLFAGRSC